MEGQIALYSKRVLLEEGLKECTLLIYEGRILEILEGREEEAGYQFVDCDNLVIMAGIIDPHVHLNEPGRTEWEGFETGTAAAAAGGVTTLVEMPLNASPVTTTRAAFNLKIAAAKGKMHVNCGFWGGIIPENLGDLPALADGGVLGYKTFLTHSGIDEFPNTDPASLKAAYGIISPTLLPILAHCELTTGDYSGPLFENPRSYQAYLASRPKKWENDAVDLMLELAEAEDVATHIVHLSSIDPLDKIKLAKEKGIRLTVETCPHYLYFNAEDIPDGDTRFKCAPPIREKANNDVLWKALIDGTLDFIGSDHSPAPPATKELRSGNFQKAWGGISGIQYTLPALWTAGQQHGLTLNRLKEVLCEAPAAFIGQEFERGKIQLGYVADLVVWNPEEAFKVTKEGMQARHKISPYEGETLNGVVYYTYVNGHLVWNKNILSQQAKGSLITSLT